MSILDRYSVKRGHRTDAGETRRPYAAQTYAGYRSRSRCAQADRPVAAIDRRSPGRP
jgi:hypothetical protein